MKKIICKVEYDTETATLVAKHTCGEFGDPAGYEESLYVTESGKFFLYVNGGEESLYPEVDGVMLVIDDFLLHFSQRFACSLAFGNGVGTSQSPTVDASPFAITIIVAVLILSGAFLLFSIIKDSTLIVSSSDCSAHKIASPFRMFLLA